eukprot:g19629.t1
MHQPSKANYDSHRTYNASLLSLTNDIWEKLFRRRIVELRWLDCKSANCDRGATISHKTHRTQPRSPQIFIGEYRSSSDGRAGTPAEGYHGTATGVHGLPSALGYLRKRSIIYSRTVT